MTKKDRVRWTKAVEQEFIEKANLDDELIALLRSRIRGDTITKQAEMFHCGTATISRRIDLLKQLYDAVQATSDTMPPRRSSKEEEFMDTH